MDLIKNEVMKMMGAQIVKQGLKRVIEQMDLIKREIIQDKKMIMTAKHDLHTDSSWGPASTWQSSTINPVFDDSITNQLLDKLTGQQSGLQVIPIVGMGGIGKTTFATYLYSHPLIVETFDILAWVTISQEYSGQNILRVLCEEVMGSINGLSEMSESKIGEVIHKTLWTRRFLIVMDDIWSVEAWDKVKSFFPNNNNGSRVMITTRLSDLALELSGGYIFRMPYLAKDKSWDLLCKIVFGKRRCPTKLEKIGKEIARRCRGLPLGIAVIGGLLKKSNMKQAYWLYTLENLNLLINLEDGEYTLRLLRTSYKELPMHLKPCFLYIGFFPEDHDINMTMLVKLWVAEGIMRPIDNKRLEEVAEDYLKELIDRNLILVSKLRWNGEAKVCKIHDLLRDLCLREARKQKLFCVLRQQKHHTLQGIDMERRIYIFPETESTTYSPQFLEVVESASYTRSLLYKTCACHPREEAPPSLRFRLLRVYSPGYKYNCICNMAYSNHAIFKHTNLRYLYVRSNFGDLVSRLLSSCSHFWNLQTLEISFWNIETHKPIIASAIWEIPLLRHVKLSEFLLTAPPYGEDNFVLENLQTLSLVKNFKLSEEVVRKIPNIRKLKLRYEWNMYDEEKILPDFCLNNLGRLQKLESLNLDVLTNDDCDHEKVARSLASFPQSLKKLNLVSTKLHWEELTIGIDSLPLLQFLTLHWNACIGPKWKTVEGQFRSLKFLDINICDDLIHWETDSAHFPRLENLVLQRIEELEIPSSIGDIPTLKSIELEWCDRIVEDSAKRIKEEQAQNGNDDLQVEINSYRTDEDREENFYLDEEY